jgi:predicted metal-dependent hydrolase
MFESGSHFLSGLDLIRSGEFFAAHEELELEWRAAETGERDFYQGLVHVAVAWYQAAPRAVRAGASGRGRPFRARTGRAGAGDRRRGLARASPASGIEA